MIKYLKVPKTDHGDFYDKARFALSWNIGVIFLVVMAILTIITFLCDDIYYPYYLTTLLLVLFGLSYMYVKRTYKLISFIISIAATIVVVYSVVSIENTPHIIESLWMVVIALLSFFTLGNRWGVFFLIINAIFYFFYFNFLFQDTLELRLNLSKIHTLIMSIEFAFSMFLIGFIMFQFGLINKYAEEHKIKAFEALQKEKSVVEQQNEEKTVLLQEIHHRVKNNLQVIISLLRIQSNELKKPDLKQSFDEAINRIMAMSLIHKKMYEKEALVNIHIVDYLNTLIEDVIHTNATKSKIVHTIDGDIEKIGSKTIVPLALIVNELVSNTLKHAFDGKGTIRLTLKHIEDNCFEMKYSDNGKWKRNLNESSFGLQLIDVFTDQLEGSFERTIDENGTHYIFQLKSVDQ